MQFSKSFFALVLGLGLVTACNDTGGSSSSPQPLAASTPTPSPIYTFQYTAPATTPTAAAAIDNLKIHSYRISRANVTPQNYVAVVHQFVVERGAKAKYQFLFCHDGECKEEAFVVDCNGGAYCRVLVQKDGEYVQADRSRAYWIDRDYGRDFFVADPHFDKLGTAYSYQLVAVDDAGHKSEPFASTGNGMPKAE